MARLRFTGFINDGTKVDAIKAMRGATGLGLKESKVIVEDLEANKPSGIFELEINEQTQNWLDSFKDAGGSFTVDDGLDSMVRNVIDAALDKGAYSYAQDLITVLAKQSPQTLPS